MTDKQVVDLFGLILIFASCYKLLFAVDSFWSCFSALIVLGVGSVLSLGLGLISED